MDTVQIGPKHIDANIVMGEEERGEFGRMLDFPVHIEMCTSTKSIRASAHVPNDMDFRVVPIPGDKRLHVFIREKDFDVWQARREKNRKRIAAENEWLALLESLADWGKAAIKMCGLASAVGGVSLLVVVGAMWFSSSSAGSWTLLGAFVIPFVLTLLFLLTRDKKE